MALTVAICESSGLLQLHASFRRRAYVLPRRKSRDTWYVEVDGRQINLGKDREIAFQRYHPIMAVPPEIRPIHAMGTGEGMKLTELFDRFLDWVKQHRVPYTFVWYQYRLQRYPCGRIPCDSCPDTRLPW